MSCKICDRYSCTESFHSTEEQYEFEKYENQLDRYSRRDLIELLKEVDLLRSENEVLREVNSEYKYLVKDFREQLLSPNSNFDIEDYDTTLEHVEELENS